MNAGGPINLDRLLSSETLAGFNVIVTLTLV